MDVSQGPSKHLYYAAIENIFCGAKAVYDILTKKAVDKEKIQNTEHGNPMTDTYICVWRWNMKKEELQFTVWNPDSYWKIYEAVTKEWFHKLGNKDKDMIKRIRNEELDKEKGEVIGNGEIVHTSDRETSRSIMVRRGQAGDGYVRYE